MVSRSAHGLLLGLLLLAAPPALADDLGSDPPPVSSAPVLPEPEQVEEEFPSGARLTGREIYERFIDQRFHESHQSMHVVSRDPGGSEQTSVFTVSIRDKRDENREPTDGILAKTLIHVVNPYDVRHTRYLMIAKKPGPDDEFVYQPSQGIVRRVDLKKTSLLGTDFTFNDIAFQNIEDADYFRLADETIQGVPVYVVETHVKERVDIEYHRTMLYLEKEHYVPLRIRYWDDFGVEVRELVSPAESIHRFEDVWVARESTMRDLRQHTSSTLYVDALDTTPGFNDKTFSTTSLTKGH